MKNEIKRKHEIMNEKQKLISKHNDNQDDNNSNNKD